MKICPEVIVDTSSGISSQEAEVFCRKNGGIPCPVVSGGSCLEGHSTSLVSVSGDAIEKFPESLIAHALIMPATIQL